MSLEAKIDALTAAVEKLTTTSENLLALRSAAIDEIKGAAAGARGAPKAGAKAATKLDEAPAGAADPANRLADVQAICAEYAGGSDRTEERDARKAKLAWLFGKVGAKKLGEIPEGKEAAVIKAVKQLIADGDLTEAPAGDGDGGETSDPDDLLAG